MKNSMLNIIKTIFCEDNINDKLWPKFGLTITYIKHN